MITPDTFELPAPVIAALRELVGATLDVADPLERVAVIKTVTSRVEETIGKSALTLTIREARAARYTFVDIGLAYGVTPQRAQQLSRTNEPLEGELTQ